MTDAMMSSATELMGLVFVNIVLLYVCISEATRFRRQKEVRGGKVVRIHGNSLNERPLSQKGIAWRCAMTEF